MIMGQAAPVVRRGEPRSVVRHFADAGRRLSGRCSIGFATRRRKGGGWRWLNYRDS
jgi:hypothetical protein